MSLDLLWDLGYCGWVIRFLLGSCSRFDRLVGVVYLGVNLVFVSGVLVS